MRTVLITGCSSGFGYASALAFARRGDRVFAGCRDVERATHLAVTASDESLAVHLLPLDVTDDASVAAAVGHVLDRAGTVDVLVNNAGIAGGGPVEEVSEHVVRELFETNTFGPIRMARSVLPTMRARRCGSIVNVSSVAGRASGPLLGPYAASKSALASLVEALFFEVADLGIAVTLVECAVYRTGISANARRHDYAPDSPYGPLAERIAASRAAAGTARDPGEVVDAVLAASDEPAGSRRLRFVVGDHTRALIAARDGNWDDWVDRVRSDPGRR